MAKPRFARKFLSGGARASLITATLALAGVAAPASATSFISGSIGAGTTAHMDAGSPPDSSASSAIMLSSPNNVGVSASSSVSTPSNGAVTAYASSAANWLSASAGTINMSWGWDFNPLNTPSFVATDTVRGWTYTFSTGNVAERFNANWTSTVTVNSGTSFGLNAIYGGGGLPYYVSPDAVYPTSGSGSFFVNLLPNSTYTFELYNQGNISAISTIANASQTANFNWTISPVAGVPEPAVWALMILGFGVIGGAMRRRKASVAHA